MEKKRFKAVIATDGRATMLIYNGKAYGNFITGVDFSHYAGEDPIMKITADKEPLPPEGTMDMDTFKKFLEHVMSEDEKETEAQNRTVRLEGPEMVMEWLNSQEERCDMMLKENTRRRKFFEGEMSAIYELKKLVQGNAAETDRPEI